MRVKFEAKGHGGKVYAGIEMEFQVPAHEWLSYVAEPREVPDAGAGAAQVAEPMEAQQAEERFMQEGADQEIQVASQRLRVEDDQVAEELGADAEGQGRQYLSLWQHGWITDDMVKWRWGPGMLEEFRAKGQIRDSQGSLGGVEAVDEEEIMLQAVLIAEDFAGDSQREERASEAATEEYQGEQAEHLMDCGDLQQQEAGAPSHVWSSGSTAVQGQGQEAGEARGPYGPAVGQGQGQASGAPASEAQLSRGQGRGQNQDDRGDGTALDEPLESAADGRDAGRPE